VTASPRIPPLAQAELDPATSELLHSCVQDETADNNIYRTIVRHPRVFKRWTGFGAVLLYGWIPERDRELVVLRTALNCDCEYEWEHHKELARQRGVSAEEVEAVRKGPDWPGWSAWDATLLRAADELHYDSRLGDATWAALAERYDNRLLIELPFLVGNYHAVAFAVNSLGIQYEGKGE
jgi:AhpD family alkylhydroperoxidase